MSFCTKCGNKLDDGANYCGFCGTPIDFGCVLGAGNIHYSNHISYSVFGLDIIGKINKSKKILSSWLARIIICLVFLIFAGLLLCVICVAFDLSDIALLICVIIVSACLFPICYYVEVLKRKYLTFVDFNLEPGDRFEWSNLINLFSSLCQVDRLWLAEKEWINLDHRRNAGAGSFSIRSISTAMLIQTKCTTGFDVVLNVSSFAIKCNYCKILFLPGGIIISRRGKLASYSFAQIQITSGSVEFIEEEYIPKDTEIVGYTWRFVNKDGTPDRRFNGNEQLAICKYGVIRITGNNLDLMFYTSNQSASLIIENAYKRCKSLYSSIGNTKLLYSIK